MGVRRPTKTLSRQPGLLRQSRSCGFIHWTGHKRSKRTSKTLKSNHNRGYGFNICMVSLSMSRGCPWSVWGWSGDLDTAHQSSVSFWLEGFLLPFFCFVDPVSFGHSSKLLKLVLHFNLSISNFEMTQLKWKDVNMNHHLPHHELHIQISLQNRKGSQSKDNDDERDLRGTLSRHDLTLKFAYVLNVTRRSLQCLQWPPKTVDRCLASSSYMAQLLLRLHLRSRYCHHSMQIEIFPCHHAISIKLRLQISSQYFGTLILRKISWLFFLVITVLEYCPGIQNTSPSPDSVSPDFALFHGIFMMEGNWLSILLRWDHNI